MYYINDIIFRKDNFILGFLKIWKRETTSVVCTRVCRARTLRRNFTAHRNVYK